MHVRAKWRYYQPLCDFVTSWQLGLTRTDDIHICANLSTLDRKRFHCCCNKYYIDVVVAAAAATATAYVVVAYFIWLCI